MMANCRKHVSIIFPLKVLKGLQSLRLNSLQVLSLMCAGCKGHSANPRHPLRGPAHHDHGHPLRLQLRVQAA